MDPQQQQLKQLQDLFTNAQDILIITRENPSIDGLSAALALYSILSGQRTLQGKNKNVVVTVSGRQGSQYTLLPGADKIASELGLRDLVIGINGYVDKSIENVNWYVDNGKLNVVFKANPAVPMQFDLKNLDPFYAGANFDVVIVLDTAAPTDLGNAYRQDPGMYAELPVVNISTNPQNTRFGKINIVDPNVPAVSELAYQLVQILRYPLNSDAATLLAVGIQDATNNLQTKGAQTDAFMQQLQSHGARPLDLESVRKQGENAVAPIVQAPAALTPQQYPTGAPQMNNPYPQYPQSPYGMPQYPQYPPQGYPQQPGYYPPYMPQGYPQQPMMPPQYAQYPQQPPMYAPEYAPQSEPQQVEEPQQIEDSSGYGAYSPQEVPSIQHDALQHEAYIPTSDIPGYSHVEPSLYIPTIDQDQSYSGDFAQPDANDTLEERKEQARTPDTKAPDWKNAPKFFEGSKER